MIALANRDRSRDAVSHDVYYGCDYEGIVGDDRVVTAIDEVLHRKRTEHPVEYEEIGENSRRTLQTTRYSRGVDPCPAPGDRLLPASVAKK